MAIRLGDDAPNFTAQTTEGKVDFHSWLGQSWGVLFPKGHRTVKPYLRYTPQPNR